MQVTHIQALRRLGVFKGLLSRIAVLGYVRAVILSLVVLPGSLLAVMVPQPTTNVVSLAWDASPSTNVVAYCVYCGTASGDYSQSIVVTNGTSGVFSNLVAGQTYYFAV